MSCLNDEGATLSRGHQNPKYYALNNKALKYMKSNTNTKRNRQIFNYSYRF